MVFSPALIGGYLHVIDEFLLKSAHGLCSPSSAGMQML